MHLLLYTLMYVAVLGGNINKGTKKIWYFLAEDMYIYFYNFFFFFC